MWACILEIIAGIVVLILAVYVILSPNIAIDLLRLILAIGLIVLGFILLVRGATSKILSTAGKLLNVLLGVIVLALGVAAIVYANFWTAFVLLLFAIGPAQRDRQDIVRWLFGRGRNSVIGSLGKHDRWYCCCHTRHCRHRAPWNGPSNPCVLTCPNFPSFWNSAHPHRSRKSGRLTSLDLIFLRSKRFLADCRWLTAYCDALLEGGKTLC